MNYKLMNRLFAGAVFILALVVYIMTVQPTVPFWDCGEFSGASIWQQVPHPPGAPLFLMLGKLFHIILPFGDPGWRLNMLSVIASAATVVLLYLITVKAIEIFSGKPKDLASALSTYGSGFIAGAALIFSDTFWFNAVESEVYAASTLFVAAITYLMMLWNEKADDERSEKYLLLIVYLIGLSTGVHLLAVLTLFGVYLLVYFRKYKFKITTFVGMGAIAVVSFFFIYPFVIKFIPAFLAGHTTSRSMMTGQYTIENSTFLQIVAIGSIVIAFGLFIWGRFKNYKIISFISASFLLIILGYTTYTQILIRSHSNSPMNENEPKTFSGLAYYLGREQYGNAPMKTRRYQLEDRFIQKYVEKTVDGEFKYGEWYYPEFDYETGDYNWPKENRSGDIQYMIKYQMGHMYWRYFGWNFIGRVSDVQDAGIAKFSVPIEHNIINHNNGYIDEFPIRFYYLPLIFGLFGLIFHFYRDPKRALVFLALFLLTGVLAALQQNQQDPQPRERDYFYAGSFFIWCLWIGMGLKAMLELFFAKKQNTAITIAGFIVAILAIPINMAAGGWKIHSRAGNYLPFDYSYNILQSCEKDAILFTNGDNDTFPVWYLQDVMGIRRDVRVVNLSLGQTLWYIDQLKNRSPWGAAKIPLRFKDSQLRVDETSELALQPMYDRDAKLISIPVKPSILAKYTNDPNLINSGKMQFLWQGNPKEQQNPQGKQNYYVNHQLVREIVEVLKFERPCYFSTTVGPDVFSGLGGYLRLEGMAWRICPVRQTPGEFSEEMDVAIMHKCLMETDNSNNFSTTAKYGFKFRNLNNMNVYYDEVHRRLMDSYRHLYYVYANYALNTLKDKELTSKILNKMESNISSTQFPMDYDMCYRFATILDKAGAIEQRNKMAELGIKRSRYVIEHPEIDPEMLQREITGQGIGPRRVIAWLYQAKEDWTQAKAAFESFKSEIEQAKSQYEAMYNNGDQSVLELLKALDNAIIGIDMEIDELTIWEANSKGGKKAALKRADDILAKRYASGNPFDSMYANYFKGKIEDIKRTLGIEPIALDTAK